MENLVINIFCSTSLFKNMINYGDIGKKLILGTFTSSSSFSNSRNLKVRFLICYFIIGPHWDSSRANFLSKAGQNSNIFKRFLSKTGQNSNSQTGNHTPLQEHVHTSMPAFHCSGESQCFFGREEGLRVVKRNPVKMVLGWL